MIGRRWGPKLGPVYFEYLHLRYSDPYDLERKAYVEAIYRRALEALGDRHYRHALEVGCSIGTLTERLLDRCDQLTAVDVSFAAVWRARRRLRGRSGVRVVRRRLPKRLPKGPFDLIV